MEKHNEARGRAPPGKSRLYCSPPKTESQFHSSISRPLKVVWITHPLLFGIRSETLSPDPASLPVCPACGTIVISSMIPSSLTMSKHPLTLVRAGALLLSLALNAQHPHPSPPHSQPSPSAQDPSEIGR